MQYYLFEMFHTDTRVLETTVKSKNQFGPTNYTMYDIHDSTDIFGKVL